MVIGLRWVLCTTTASACDCSTPPVQQAKTLADVVFRGTIIALRPSTKPLGVGSETERVAVFRVSRVWKGEVGPTFEMPAQEETGSCVGFWADLLKEGNELVLYATQWPGDKPGTFEYS